MFSPASMHLLLASVSLHQLKWSVCFVHYVVSIRPWEQKSSVGFPLRLNKRPDQYMWHANAGANRITDSPILDKKVHLVGSWFMRGSHLNSKTSKVYLTSEKGKMMVIRYFCFRPFLDLSGHEGPWMELFLSCENCRLGAVIWLGNVDSSV